MNAFGPIKKGERVILFNQKFGFVEAMANQDWDHLAGGSAYFAVNLSGSLSDQAPLQGISTMTINSNVWDIYPFDDPKVQKKIVDEYFKNSRVDR